jgi:hypothetical protein
LRDEILQQIKFILNTTKQILIFMRKLGLLFNGLFFLLFATVLNAQSKTGADYFTGKWNMMVKGLPNGDTKMVVSLEKTGDKMTGIIQDSTGKKVSDISKVELTDSSATVYFSAQGYDVNLLMNKKDDDHVTGSMMNMFDSEGDRVKMVN